LLQTGFQPFDRIRGHLRFLGIAEQGQDISALIDLDLKGTLNIRDIAVIRAEKFGRDCIVFNFDFDWCIRQMVSRFILERFQEQEARVRPLGLKW
jgi:hypothetical protein